jgi:hypothetical protein
MEESAVKTDDQMMSLPDLKGLSKEQRGVFSGLTWPGEVQIEMKKVIVDDLLMSDTLEWIGRVVRPGWLPTDLRSRLVAAREIIEGSDAFVSRYEMLSSNFQIMVTKEAINLAIKPPGFPIGNCHRRFAEEIMNRFLRMSPSEGAVIRPWESIEVKGFTFAYQPVSFWSDWRDSLTYLTNGQTVKFSVRKINSVASASGPPRFGIARPQSWSHRWFN